MSLEEVYRQSHRSKFLITKFHIKPLPGFKPREVCIQTFHDFYILFFQYLQTKVNIPPLYGPLQNFYAPFLCLSHLCMSIFLYIYTFYKYNEAIDRQCVRINIINPHSALPALTACSHCESFMESKNASDYPFKLGNLQTVLQLYQMQHHQIFANSQSNLQMPALVQHLPSFCCNSPLLSKSITHTEEYSWMDEYLNLEVFKLNHQPNQLLPAFKPDPPLPLKKQTENQSKESAVQPPTGQRKNRSIFHNFQKHIITLLKRIVNIRRIQLLNSPSGLRAYQFWKLFKISKDYTKKTLYMIFGVAQHENIKNLKKLAQQLPDLQKILEKMSKEDIEAAQALLRQKIGAQISGFQKQFIRHNCKMEKFEQFHSYFLNFIDQLQNPGLSKRLRKDKKRRLVQSSISQEEQRE